MIVTESRFAAFSRDGEENSQPHRKHAKNAASMYFVIFVSLNCRPLGALFHFIYGAAVHGASIKKILFFPPHFYFLCYYSGMEAAMDVVYLFHDNDKISVPFTNYDHELFLKVVRSGAGFWDRKRGQFTFSNQVLNDETINRIFYGHPLVHAGENGDSAVSGFFNRPWRIKAEEERPVPAERAKYAEVETPVKLPPALSDNDCLIDALALPEMFSSVWADKLRTELHSRKYSPRTIMSYIHYNRSFCKRIQKCPEDVTSEDIRGYLAYLDKTLDLSASSMNLAISSLKFFYMYVMKKDITREQRRPRHDKKLPGVLPQTWEGIKTVLFPVPFRQYFTEPPKPGPVPDKTKYNTRPILPTLIWNRQGRPDNGP
jgi:hypothetical protein